LLGGATCLTNRIEAVIDQMHTLYLYYINYKKIVFGHENIQQQIYRALYLLLFDLLLDTRIGDFDRYMNSLLQIFGGAW